MGLRNLMKYGEAEISYEFQKDLCNRPVLDTLFWETTLRCNAKCKHCGSRAGENVELKDELKTEEIKKVFKEVADRYDASKILVAVTGGEPLVREDVFDVMTYAKSFGYVWGMTTNGILINDDVIDKMKSSGMESISISLDGLQESHDKFRGVPGSYQKIINNIKKLKEANFLKCFQVTTVVNKSNIKELEKLYEIIKELKLDSWRVINMDPIGRANDNVDLALDNDDYNYLINFIKEKRKKSKFEVTYGCAHFLGIKNEKETRNHVFSCRTGLTIGSVLYNGDIFVCPNVVRRPELIQGNIRKDSFVEVWENKFEWFRNINKLKKGECEKCENWNYCRGDSVHTWDFENNRPKLCLRKILK